MGVSSKGAGEGMPGEVGESETTLQLVGSATLSTLSSLSTVWGSVIEEGAEGGEEEREEEEEEEEEEYVAGSFIRGLEAQAQALTEKEKEEGGSEGECRSTSHGS